MNGLEAKYEDWWKTVGCHMKNEPGENINDSELPRRISKAAWTSGYCEALDFILNKITVLSDTRKLFEKLTEVKE